MANSITESQSKGIRHTLANFSGNYQVKMKTNHHDIHSVVAEGDVQFSFFNLPPDNGMDLHGHSFNVCILNLIQDGTGGHAFSFNDEIHTPGGMPLDFTLLPNARDIVTILVDPDKKILNVLSFQKNVKQYIL